MSDARLTLLDFPDLLAAETEATIWTRWQAWANEGVDPDDLDQLVDTREGQPFQMLAALMVREAARVYDWVGTEVLAASHPLFAFGPYLELHAEVQDLDRLPATSATGVVTLTGEPGTEVFAGAVVGTEPADPDAPAPEFELIENATLDATTGIADVPVRAREPGPEGNVGAGAIVALLSLPGEVALATNADPTRGGTGTQLDGPLLDRLLDAYAGPRGGARRRDIERIARAWPGVGGVTVVPTSPNAGVFRVIVWAPDGGPVSAEVLDGLQEHLDPEPGQSRGEGPAGARIIVVTAAEVAVDVSATLVLEAGYSVTGADGLRPVLPAIRAALAGYVDELPAGATVRLSQVEARIVTAPGVLDVSGVQINGLAQNLATTTDPPQAPHLDDLALAV